MSTRFLQVTHSKRRKEINSKMGSKLRSNLFTAWIEAEITGEDKRCKRQVDPYKYLYDNPL